jgi:hypothetical protein
MDFQAMIAMNDQLLDHFAFCFCTYCIMSKIPKIRVGDGVVGIPAHVDRDTDLAVLMLAAFSAHFNTVARMDGVYAEARKSFLENDGLLGRMRGNPVRSTVWIEVPVLVALEIVINFDPRLDQFGSGIRGLPPARILE